jgi:enoyl-CoA hydratase/carnithine racemase
MSAPEVSYSRQGRLGVIRLERPQALNALTLPMVGDITRFAFAAERDPGVTAICITGAGRGFCAGLDVSVLAEHARSGPPQRTEPREDRPVRPALFSFLLDISKPVIGAINGVAAGGGFVLAMMCDLRFIAQDAAFTTVFSRRGLIAEHGTSWLLPRMIGLSRALDILWSSRKIGAQEAYHLGLADKVVPSAELLAATEAYVEELAATVSPRAIAVIKAQVHRHLATTFDVAALESEKLMSEALRHPDATEGAVSFIERRTPKFAAWTGGKS